MKPPSAEILKNSFFLLWHKWMEWKIILFFQKDIAVFLLPTPKPTAILYNEFRPEYLTFFTPLRIGLSILMRTDSRLIRWLKKIPLNFFAHAVLLPSQPVFSFIFLSLCWNEGYVFTQYQIDWRIYFKSSIWNRIY